MSYIYIYIHIIYYIYMGVSKNRGMLKWMVFWVIMENPIEMDDLGVPLFLETPIYCFRRIDGHFSQVLDGMFGL